MKEPQMVGMAEVRVCRDEDSVLMALGLGSCVGICAYETRAHIAGLAHVVLPSSSLVPAPPEMPGKFADTAIPLLLQEMTRWGANPRHIVFALCGGAQVFMGAGIGNTLNIGARNAHAVQEAAMHHNLQVAATDLGGSCGRTVRLFGNGLVSVKTLGKGERALVNLGDGNREARVAIPLPKRLRDAEQL